MHQINVGLKKGHNESWTTTVSDHIKFQPKSCLDDQNVLDEILIDKMKKQQILNGREKKWKKNHK